MRKYQKACDLQSSASLHDSRIRLTSSRYTADTLTIHELQVQRMKDWSVLATSDLTVWRQLDTKLV